MKVLDIRVTGALMLFVGFVLCGLGALGALGSLGSFFFSSVVSGLDSALSVLISAVLLVAGGWMMKRARLQ
ncbi:MULTISPECIES: hypothetical protein [Burkholderia]|jgi:hypothetical protein|uniref:TMEM43 family protein n=1 Tax=Burkholderia contaminans TaxID=488447 RepID=A0A1E3FN16_9BURK|nr:hypothetical protein [Burkholderia contaminans]ELK7724797.1 hypothetical protein [Burkholderia cenocepacia]UTP27911.1 TMEM43 family protein [Burkholderia sp. FXe9]HBN6128490.1 hypothetical protein [Clostridioides difficile]MBA9833489.1 hypothetical protein [Burkholderia contaminans]MBH9693742.1 hypothetical protein [Burkholderia contaminans]